MNKTQKRQLNLRNKLFAAIAMLLVSSIMMVSTTYAWFTLSTAPEVQGITTTVGANGNLEIALSPADGDTSKIGSAMGDSTLDWVAKNLTWGNLLDLSSTSYGLEAITLLPARLNIGAINTSPLKTPVYGADGRVEKLEANTRVGQPVLESNGYTYNVSETFRGVRAVGTSSSMTKYQITFNNYLASMGQNASAARDLAEVSLKNNGAKLANMAVTHASAGSDDSNDYTEYKLAMTDVIANLQASNAKLKDAIRDAFIATAASNFSGNNEDTYDDVMDAVEAKATLEALLVAAGNATWADQSTNTITVTGVDSISVAYTKWKTIDGRLDDASDKLATIDTSADGKIQWNEASPILYYLMETTGIKLNGNDLSTFKTQAQRYLNEPTTANDSWKTYYLESGEADITMEEAQRRFNVASETMKPFLQGKGEMQLGAGSGIYAEIAEMVGNLSAPITVDIVYGTFKVPDAPITIKTTTANPADSGNMGTIRTDLATVGAFQDANADLTGVLNETYGYIVDFFFRTNASNSNLLLQSDPAQRVYSDATSGETLGNGSSMTFRTGNISGNAVEGLMSCIRVVFLDTTNYNVLGIAALDMANATQKVVTAGTDGAADIVDITARLYLQNYHENESGQLVLDSAKTNKADAVLCSLPTNTAKAVSVMVYLDGDNVTNEDVANAATSTTGTLNLQFASSETLVPMDNEALHNMAESTKYSVTIDNKTNAVVHTSSSTVKEKTDYSFSVTDGDYAVSYKIGETTTALEPVSTANGVDSFKIPAANVTGDITIIVTSTAVGGNTGNETTLTATTVTVNATGLTEDVTVTVTGRAAADATENTTQTVTLNATTTTGTVTVYTGTDVDYTVTVPSGYVVTESPDNTWTVTTAPAQGN